MYISIFFIESFRQIQGEVESKVGNANPDIKTVLKTIRRKGKNKNSAAVSRHKKLSRLEQLRKSKQEKLKELHSKRWYVGEVQVIRIILNPIYLKLSCLIYQFLIR